LLKNVLLVNTPQLAISLIYVFYNSLLTRMLVAYEYSKFGRTPNGLRVSRPVGDQRSTLWLQLPYRYIIPVLASMSLIHWLLSRGMRLTSIKVYDIQGQEVPSRTRFTYTTSQMLILLVFVVGTAMLIALFMLMSRKLGTGIPIVGTCSIAISAACHVPQGDEKAATKRVMYGASTVRDDGGSMFMHAAFSSKSVQPLQEGVIYK
jgi:hypothetical protein